MKILAIGDIYGKIGRRVISELLKKIINENQIDLVVANVENATHGKGLIKKHYLELKKYGINIMTSGNHIFSKEETTDLIEEVSDLIRPLNSSFYHPGEGTILTELKGKKIRVTNLLGNDFMPINSGNPYYFLEKVIEKDDSDIHLVDFHAESTGEKNAFALYYDGKISALWGTHTHVQTSDERILPKGTGFITDLGMTGPYNGVIGAEPSSIFKRAKFALSSKVSPCDDKDDKGQFNGAIFTFDETNNKVLKINRIRIIL